MLANPTTLIVGAGASVALKYPTGVQLRDWIIEGRGMSYEFGEEANEHRKRLEWRLSRSLIPSIDAFLAEKANEDLRRWGVLCIAGALLPCEAEEKRTAPAWLRLIFNAIRGETDQDHRYPLKIVTFNYDLSIEYFLYDAFLASYKGAQDIALARFKESVEIIHVYGQLGQIIQLGGDREYGGEVSLGRIHSSAKDLRIIGREPDHPAFAAAHQAILEAEFLAVLGFGYDQTNIANLKLRELAGSKYLFSTGYDMGYGMRGWIRRMGLPLALIGSPHDDVERFLHNSGFLHWANTPNEKAAEMHDAIHQYLARRLAY